MIIILKNLNKYIKNIIEIYLFTYTSEMVI